MSQRFGQSADYSQSFAFLWQQQDQALTYRAEQLEQRTEADQRARDDLMFTKYQEGKISGTAILAYIQKRIRQTGYSKAEQRKWKEALVEYRNNVVDNRATAAYNETGNIHAYIAHWQKRLGSTQRGTPERTEISSMLRQLKDSRDATALQNEAARLEREVNSGNKSTKDLIDLYKSKLGTASPALKSQIRDALAGLRKRYKQEQFETAYRKTMDAYKAGRISPQEAADQLGTSADKWGIQTIDPARFNQIQSGIVELNGTADPVVVARLNEQLSEGKISAQDYRNGMFELARQVGPYNQEGAINLRAYARQQAEQYELANPAAIGQGGGSTKTAQEVLQGAGSIRFISQLDNSKYSLQNCTYASAAMIAAMMGHKKFNGADLRNASRDFSGGGTLLDAQNALMRKGVDGTRVRYDNRIEFEKFKQNIKQGAPASLSGYLGAMRGGSIHNAGLSAGHNIVVVKYHPKKGFLVMDPARSKKANGKYWMKEEDLKTFGWSARPGTWYRYGQAMFAPKGTIQTRWNKGKDFSGTPGGRGINKRDGVKVSGPAGGGGYGDEAQTAGALGISGGTGGAPISEDGEDVPGDSWYSVEDTPLDPSTPPEYAGQYAPGPDDVNAAIDVAVARSMNPELEELMDAGIVAGDPNLVTPQMVENEINARNAEASADFQVLVGFMERWSGDPTETVKVETDDGVVRLTIEDAQDLQLGTLADAQALILLNDATGNEAGSAQALQQLRGSVLMGQELVTTEYETNRTILFRSTTGDILAKVANGDTEGALQAAIDGLDSLVELGDDVTEPEDSYDPLTGQAIPGEDKARDDADADNSGHVTAVEQAEYDSGQLPDSVPLADEAKTTSMGDVQGLEQLRDMLVGSVESGEPIPWDQLVQTIDAFAIGAGIDMPRNWAEGDLTDGSADGIGLAVLTQNLHDQSRVSGGQAEWVHVNGQIYAVGVDQDTIRYDANGQPVVEPVPVEGELESGDTAQVDYSGGMQVQLDMGELKDALDEQASLDEDFAYDPGILNSPEGLTLIPRMVDGELVHEYHVPSKEHYGNINFLRIADNPGAASEMLKQMTGLDIDFEDNAYVDQNIVSQIASAPGGSRFLREVINANLGERVPFEANVIRLEGREEWEDPVTGVWHTDGLPWGNGAIPGGEAVGSNHGFTGAKVDGDMGTGLAVPDVMWASNEDASTGHPVPKYDSVTEENAQLWYESMVGAGVLDPVIAIRDENGDAARIDPESEQAHSWWTDKFVTEAKRQAELVEKQREEAEARMERLQDQVNERTEQSIGNIQDFSAQVDGDPFAMSRLNDQLNEVLKGNQVNPWAPPKPVPAAPEIQTAMENLPSLKLDPIKIPTTSAPGANPGGIAGMTFNPETGYQATESYEPPEPPAPSKAWTPPMTGGGAYKKK